MATEPRTLHEVREGRPEGAPSRATEPEDYAAINAVWAALLAAVILATRERGARTEPIEARELIPLSAATFALSKAIAREKVGTWVREPFVDEERGGKPEGRRLRRAVGELVTCTRCVGTWSALGIVCLRLASPQAGRIATNVLAVSAANDYLQSGFKWLCGRANRAE
jgi:hypothetical protein